MSVKYKIYQDNRKNIKNKGYWYARSVTTGQVGIKEMAVRISDRCTVTESDILAVLSALVTEMEYELKNGYCVKLDGFGSFKLALRSHGVAQIKDFSATKHIHSPHVLFRPEYHIGADKVRLQTFLQGVKVEEMPTYEGVDKGDKGGKGEKPGPVENP